LITFKIQQQNWIENPISADFQIKVRLSIEQDQRFDVTSNSTMKVVFIRITVVNPILDTCETTIPGIGQQSFEKCNTL
jgi:hypothetical protein